MITIISNFKEVHKVKLENICDVFSGYAFKSFNEDKQGLPIIKIGNIKMDGSVDLDNCSYSTEVPNCKYKSRLNDIYIALSGATTGKIGMMISEEYFYINQRVGIVRLIDNNVPINYLRYFLMSKTNKILNDAAGAAQPNISPKDVSKYDFIYKDIFEMNRIANELNNAYSLIGIKKKQLTMFDELIKSRFICQEVL